MLVLDRGYPASWLLAILEARGIRWCMRCDNEGGWSPVRKFMRSGLDAAWVTLSAPSADDAATWGCARTAPRVRLVRQVAPGGAIRVVTNLDSCGFPCHAFADLYHQRWRIEEGFDPKFQPLQTVILPPNADFLRASSSASFIPA